MPHADTFMYRPHFDEMTQIALDPAGTVAVKATAAERARDGIEV